ncbi:MAG: hypothetical protein JST11_13975 [Acidobacteria bacterium]|nr:hypothetical protein [Acidobacteriota bacterium]
MSYLYHGLLALVLLALGLLVTLAGGAQSLRLDMLPWSGSTLLWVLVLGGLFGLCSVLLAIKGKVRPLFFLWALVVVIYLVKGFFLGGYRFTPDSFSKVMYLVLGSLVALLGAFLQMFRPSKR